MHNKGDDWELVTCQNVFSESRRLVQADESVIGEYILRAASRKTLSRVDDDGDARYSVWGMIVPRERTAAKPCGTEVVPRFLTALGSKKRPGGGFCFPGECFKAKALKRGISPVGVTPKKENRKKEGKKSCSSKFSCSQFSL